MAASIDQLPAGCDIAVIGGGIVGLATARELGRRHPGAEIVVLEREARLATHQSGHSSGVIHAGIYYEPGSLKARLCVEGAALLYGYCAERGIATRRDGKLIVATGEQELGRLGELERRGQRNGVAGLRRLGAAGLREIEPHASGLAALHSPGTGVVDFAKVAQALAEDFTAGGGTVVTAAAVIETSVDGEAVNLRSAAGGLRAGKAVFCAGAWADRLAVAAGAEADPRIVPFRGAYLQLRPGRESLVNASLYPVPDPGLPFLGVHMTRTLNGDVLLGPTALLVGARDAYRLRTVRGKDLRESIAWPGTRRLLRRHWRSGLLELHRASSVRALVAACRRLVPELTVADVVRSRHCGVRAQAVGRDGRLVDDFLIDRTERAIHVRNAPSPAATSSLALAREIANQLDAII